MTANKKTSQVLSAFIDYLHGCKRRITPERLSILEVIATQTCLFTVDDLRASMEKEMFPVSLATLYNTIELLLQAGFLKSIRPAHRNATLYRIDTADTTHVYLICKHCGAIKECAPKEPHPIYPQIRFPHFLPGYFDLCVYGLCRKCKKSGFAADTAS